MEETQKPRYDCQWDNPEETSLELNLENRFEIKGEPEFGRRQGSELTGTMIPLYVGGAAIFFGWK